MDKVVKELWKKNGYEDLLTCETIFEGSFGFPVSNNFTKGPDFHAGPRPLYTILLTTSGTNVAFPICCSHFLRFRFSKYLQNFNESHFSVVFECVQISARYPPHRNQSVLQGGTA